MTPLIIHSDRPHESILPRAYTSATQRREHYGDVQSMEADEARLEAAWHLIGKAWPWLLGIVVATAGGVLFHVARFGFERINLW